MATLNTIQFSNPESDLRALLACDKSDIGSDSVSKLKPSPVNRTLLIGLGGTGVKTIDYAKGVIQSQFDPSWKNYIAFLGIDTSWTELDIAAYLEPGEKLATTLPGVANRMSNPDTYAPAVKSFMPPNPGLPPMGTDGAGRRRLVGKIKIHDQQPGGTGADEQIVNKIQSVVNGAFNKAPLMGTGKYEVYIIGSGSGGTGSGGLLELPPLIRKAFNEAPLAVHAIFYLPDTIPGCGAEHKANGYATLKELDYFMGMYMRPDYSEQWCYGDSADSVLSFKSSLNSEHFIDIPYLVGARTAAGGDPSEAARETIAQFLISTLVDSKSTVATGGVFLTSSFLSNALSHISERSTANYLPDNEERHEAPKRYAAIGFAKACVPQDRIRAYTISQLCESAGMRSANADQRAAMLAKGVELLPFKSRDDLDNATEGTAAARSILAPIETIFQTIHNGRFTFAETLSGNEVSWKNIQHGIFDSANVQNLTNREVDAQLDDTGLKGAIQTAFAQYSNNVRNYVKENGAYAFANLYDGRFAPVGQDNGTGIRDLLDRLVEGKLFNGQPAPWLSPDVAQQNLDALRGRINNIGLIDLKRINAATLAAQWANAYERLQMAKINESRRNLAIGPNGYLAKYFQLPAALLRDQLLSFGDLLDALAGTYDTLGSPLNSYAAFSSTHSHGSMVNIAAQDSSAYNWLIGQVQNAVAAVNARNLRDSVVDAFFDNPDAWLDLPDTLYKQTPDGGYDLKNENMPIPARRLFEDVINQKCPNNINVSIEQVFSVYANTANINFKTTANNTIAALAAVSQPLINADLPSTNNYSFIYVLYPSALANAVNGPAIVAELQAAAAVTWPNQKVELYQSDSADAICVYQLVAPWEIYRLRGLRDWETQYEYYVKQPNMLLHGLSPDVTVTKVPGQPTTYTEEIPWKDYPPIAKPDRDPRLRDDTGKHSREGELLLALDALIAKARELGVLYEDQLPGGNFVVKRANCSKAIDWRLDTSALLVANNNVLPLGKDFMAALAVQNGTTLDNISRTVELKDNGGVLGMPMPTSELAWKYAADTLRVHMPMRIEIRNTVRQVEELFAQAQRAYQAQLQTLRQEPAIMAEMIKSGTFFCDDKGVWNYVNQYGLPVFVANPDFSAQLQPNVKTLLDNNLLAFYLFSELKNVMNDKQDSFADAQGRTVAAYRQLAGTGDLAKVQANQALLQQLQQEIGLIAEKGARISDSQEPAGPNPKLNVLLNAVNTNDRYAAELFYYRLNQART